MKYLIISLVILGLGGCTSSPLFTIDASKNTLNVGSKRTQPINFRTKG